MRTLPSVKTVRTAFSMRSAASLLAEVAEHQHGAEDQRRGIGEAFAGDVGGGAVDGFEHGDAVADVGAGREAEAADQAGGEVGDDVAEQVFHHHHVERLAG